MRPALRPLFALAPLAAAAWLCAACAGTVGALSEAVDPAGPILRVDRGRGLDSADRRFALHPARGRDGKPRLAIECRGLAGVVLSAPAEPAELDRLFGAPPAGELSFSLEAMGQFCNWERGYSEYERGMSGRVSLRADGGAWRLRAEAGMAPLDVAAAAIRLGDDLVRGDRAVAAMRDRLARVEALAPFLDEHLYAYFEPHPERAVRAGACPREFKDDCRDLLLPELAPPERRLPAWTDRPSGWDFAEGVAWNRDYSKALFNPQLAAVRQGGTLLRDYEEALPLIYARWRWPQAVAELEAGVDLAPPKNQ